MSLETSNAKNQELLRAGGAGVHHMPNLTEGEIPNQRPHEEEENKQEEQPPLQQTIHVNAPITHETEEVKEFTMTIEKPPRQPHQPQRYTQDLGGRLQKIITEDGDGQDVTQTNNLVLQQRAGTNPPRRERGWLSNRARFENQNPDDYSTILTMFPIPSRPQDHNYNLDIEQPRVPRIPALHPYNDENMFDARREWVLLDEAPGPVFRP